MKIMANHQAGRLLLWDSCVGMRVFLCHCSLLCHAMSIYVTNASDEVMLRSGARAVSVPSGAINPGTWSSTGLVAHQMSMSFICANTSPPPPAAAALRLTILLLRVFPMGEWNTGAIFAVDSNITVNGCAFEDNYAEVHGGAIHANRSSVVVRNTAFRRCRAGQVPGEDLKSEDVIGNGGGTSTSRSWRLL